MSNLETVNQLIKEYSTGINYNCKETAIILAAGHGKRIKSHTSKMLHKIWGIPTVERVADACIKALNNVNLIMVVGIKAEDVIKVIGKKDNTVFANQAEQLGTGHAVQVGLETIDSSKYEGIVYVYAGDMGLLDDKTVKMFGDKFKESKSDMMVLTGLYEGKPEENSYGRIIRVKEFDVAGLSSGEDFGKVIEIIEHKDILKLPDDKPYLLNFNGKTYSYQKDELINNNEFNSGVYAFKYNYLAKLIYDIKNDNAQKEIYITDLISIFNKNGLTVSAVSPKEQHVIMGFNNKSVLKEMESIARTIAYNKIKDIVEIDDPDDFFIHDCVINQILELDSKGIPLDIKIGKGVYIGKGVKLNYNLNLLKNVFVEGNIIFGENVKIWENVHLSTFEHQEFFIGNNVEILWNNIIKGKIKIGNNCRIESSVNMTGSDENPLIIGNNVTIKGTSYIFGSIIDDDIFIEHSVIIKKRIDKILKKDGTVMPIMFYLPMPRGIDAVTPLK
ncbi:MAG TPA: NTP transferase domain-containing protein [Melioribacteraceae bacterium]|nr:NTP transferase domain-containing protein [Melioribacteraceae bacterium]